MCGCSSPGWPQYQWGIFIRPESRVAAIRAIRVIAHRDQNPITIPEAAAVLDALPSRQDGYRGPVFGYRDQQDLDAYVIYSKAMKDVVFVEVEV